MIIYFVFLLILCDVINGVHFNGGTITWAPVNPYDNSSSVVITITQSYSWTYPTILCTNNVPITTPGRSTSNTNLTCVVGCATDGGYSAHPVNILTDCTSSSSTLYMMTSQRTSSVTLLANASFSISYEGSAWRALNYPLVSGSYWSILCAINLKKRPDGFINTPPVAGIVSPQYVIVNQTTQIKIPVSDANAGDDVRCRWSVYTPGYRRKRQSDQYGDTNLQHIAPNIYKNLIGKKDKYILSRIRRAATTYYTSTTTIDTPGTIPTTSSYSHRNAVDECGGICYPSSTPSGTTLSGCTITFTGLVAGAWYGVALQIEDFINSTSNQSMSSTPIQFLIYVLPTTTCSLLPVFTPITDCLEAQINVPITFDLYVNNSCDTYVSNITDIVVSASITGMTYSPMTSSPDGSFAFVTFTWTPQLNQIGPQQLCTIAFTSEMVQSDQYCVNFNVQTGPPCQTTTSTSISTTSTSISTSTSTITTVTTLITATTSTTISTSTSTITTITTLITATTSTTISTSTSTITTVTTLITATTSTTISTSTSTITTITTLITATASTSTITAITTLINATTSTSNSAITTTATTSEQTTEMNRLLILGLTLSAVLIAICCCCCCLYYFLWGAGARRRMQKYTDREQERKMRYFRSYDPWNSVDGTRTLINTNGSQSTSHTTLSNNRNNHITRVNNCIKPVEIGNPKIKAPNKEESHDKKQVDQNFSVGITKVNAKANRLTDYSVNPLLSAHHKMNLNKNVTVHKVPK